jgi:putative addiction module component (TIGR02574 family)
MKKSISIGEISELRIAEQIQFVEEVWDSIAEIPEQVKLPGLVQQGLDRRIEAYHRNPDQGSPWKEVKQRILAGK